MRMDNSLESFNTFTTEREIEGELEASISSIMDETSIYGLNMLADNDIKVRDDALKVLLKICDNVIKNPNVSKYRRIRVANAAIVDKLLNVSGGIECLFAIGFHEDGEYFTLPSNAPLSRVGIVEKSLRSLLCSVVESTPKSKILFAGTVEEDLPIPSFFQSIGNTFRSVLVYENVDLQRETKRLIPINKLQLAAIKNLRAMQKEMKLNNSANHDEIAVEDLLLVELLSWFKNEFFSWVDNPSCRKCSKPCRFERNEYPRDINISRIEIHKCPTCSGEEKFMRYTSPDVLLTTRKGRCGEWANIFTLMCRTLRYDARIVHDKTDHVWTEVWSVAGQRWIHADPCENAIDTPLLYEKGWKKKLTYIFAYSRDEIQDVTWRYTRDQTAVMKRRNLCSEDSLSALILELNEQRQSSSGYTNARRSFVLKRRLMELAEFLQAPPELQKPSENDDNEYGGRISGSAAWRLARGELSHDSQPHVWKTPRGVRVYQLRYYIIEDSYDVRDENNKVLETKNGWKEGVEACDGDIFRKVENDWKMMYLVRSPGKETGKVTWSIELGDDASNVTSFELQTTSTTFHSGVVEWSVQGIDSDGNVNKALTISDSTSFKTTELNNARKICVTAKLLGGDGDVSWQHAQLFRQSFSALKTSSFNISMTLEKAE